MFNLFLNQRTVWIILQLTGDYLYNNIKQMLTFQVKDVLKYSIMKIFLSSLII